MTCIRRSMKVRVLSATTVANDDKALDNVVLDFDIDSVNSQN